MRGDLSDDTPTLPGLIDLLGATRGQIVDVLRRRPSSVADLAGELGLSEVAIRRHLGVLEREGLVSATTVRRRGPGRPSSRYGLTARGRQLLPDNSAALADELLHFLQAEYGRSELLRFLRWRAQRHQSRYAAALAHLDTVGERAERLAELLSDDGFDARVEAVTVPDGATELQLTQGHCALESVATEHPELCAFEASLFRRLLGAPLSRRETIAGGAGACVCHIQPEHSS